MGHLEKMGATIGFVALMLGIIAFGILLVDKFSEQQQKRENFDSAYDRMWSKNKSDFMSSQNYLISVIPSAIYQTSDAEHWQRFSYSWNNIPAALNNSTMTWLVALREEIVNRERKSSVFAEM